MLVRAWIDGLESTMCFVDGESSGDQPRQVVRIRLHVEGSGGALSVAVTGGGLVTPSPVAAEPTDGELTVEVGVLGWADHSAGTAVPVTATVQDDRGEQLASRDGEVIISEPGWTMWMVPHFHYDPVWWNTQAAYTCRWDELPDAQATRGDVQQAGFDLVRAHTEAARRDPDYRFVLAEIDYLKPYWDAFPEERAILRQLMAEGRLELMGGTYNEPNSNLTSAESTARNAVYGIGFQRDIMGGAPETAWQLDVFGHDPQFPGLMADAGLANSSWARGPFHQWGPIRNPGGENKDVTRMQFPAEFRWLSPSGHGVVTSYMADHYGSGWDMASATTLAEAEASAYRNFSELAKVASTKNVLLPVGTDYTPPTQWVTEVARDWNARYASPKFVCAIPREFFQAVRAESAGGAGLWPQTRDMNPIYTGKDVSYIDIKQAQRFAEDALVDAEKFATLAGLLAGARYPEAAFDKAWRQLAYGAHHDGITGSFSDQVYLDLLTGWREAHDLAVTARDNALEVIVSTVDTRADSTADRPLVVVNPLSWPRTDVVTARVDLPEAGTSGLTVVDDAGDVLPVLTEAAEHHADGTLRSALLTFLARDVPGVGHRTFWLRPADSAPAGWSTVDGVEASSDAYTVRLDPARGGGIASLVERATAAELVRDGGVGNEFRLYDEHPAHPTFGEGPWHLLPRGPVVTSADGTAEVTVETSPIGQRITARGRLASLTYTTELRLLNGTDRVDVRSTVDGFAGADQLLRMRFPTDIPGALPVSEVADAVIGRGLGQPDVDTAEAPWTLDNPAYTWFGAGSTARVRVGDTVRAIGIAEVVADSGELSAGHLDGLVTQLGRVGVTVTSSSPERARYGGLDFDSNLPDVRISVGGPGSNAFTAQVLDGADASYAAELTRQITAHGSGRVWVPASRTLAEQFVPNADVRGVRDLPVLIIAAADADATRAAVTEVIGDLADATIDVTQDAGLATVPDNEPSLVDRTVGVLNRGMPSFVVDPAGALHLSLLRSCTGWPSGVWIDPPKRTVPDGSPFQLQHWSHTFDYAFVAGAGDWRSNRLVHSGHGFNHPLLARSTSQHDGRLASRETLISVQPETAMLETFKATGNPLSRGDSTVPDPRRQVTARLYEAHGSATEAALRTIVPLVDAHRADLLEQPLEALERAETLTVPLGGAGIVTVTARPESAYDGDGPVLAPEHEPAQPVYTRYWMHNKGPAPVGYLPLAVHVHPAELRTDGPFSLRVTAASDFTDAPVHTRVRISLPDGWTADTTEQLVGLEPGAHTEFEVAVTPASDARSGLYLVAAQADAPDGQVVEDLAVVSVGGTADVTNELSASIATDVVTAPAGQRTEFDLEIGSTARSELHGEVALVSPWGTWDILGPAAAAFSVEPGGRTTVRFAADVPGGTPPSTTWLLAKVMCAGRVLYTEAVPLAVVE